jgi:hypothetical protein
VIHGVLLDISQISLRLGHISQARDFANEAIRIEPMIEDEWSEMRSLLTLADCQLQAGELAAAGTSLVSADRKQWQYGDRLFDDPILATQCAAVLLAHNGHRMVLFRAQQALDRGVCSQWPLGLGAIYLSLALAEQENPAAAKRNLTLAIQFCRRSGAIEYEALTLLSRATDADLAEVNRIATRSGMRLLLTDYHLAIARREHDKSKALEHLEKAESLIQETGYHRRDPEASQLRQQLVGAN